MKYLLSYALLASAVLAAPHLAIREGSDDEDCSIVWVTVDGSSASSTSSATVASASGGTAGGTHGGSSDHHDSKAADTHEKAAAGTNSATASASVAAVAASSTPPATADTNSTDTGSALNLPNLPNGEPPFPINGDHLSAPVDDTPVPANAELYSPADAGVFDCLDFAQWMKKLRDANPNGGIFMKIKPGTYRYKLGPKMAEGTDPNTVEGENIVIYLMKHGWTLDMRGVTFYVDVTPENHLQRPGPMIYVLQSDDFTLLGGTVWIDQGEPFTQAKCTSIDANQVATFEVDKGYNVSAWATAGPRNQRCVLTTDPQTYKSAECNGWKEENYDFSKLESSRTFTSHIIGEEAHIVVGITMTLQVGPNSMIAISNEDNSGLHVKGFTTNGNFMSIGLANDLKPPRFDNVWQVNPPPRPGFAPRVMGPALSWGNIGGFIYNTPGQNKAEFHDSWWQYLAGTKNLQVGGDDSKPPGL